MQTKSRFGSLVGITLLLVLGAGRLMADEPTTRESERRVLHIPLESPLGSRYCQSNIRGTKTLVFALTTLVCDPIRAIMS